VRAETPRLAAAARQPVGQERILEAAVPRPAPEEAAVPRLEAPAARRPERAVRRPA